jgi:hypothetical protein
MERTLVEKIADAVLYEGYMLYPYRASSVKNRQRFNWGALAPKAYSDSQKGTEAWEMKSEFLIDCGENPVVNVKVRFLELAEREIGRLPAPVRRMTREVEARLEMVESCEVNGRLYQAWQEAVEREVNMASIEVMRVKSAGVPFSFPYKREVEELRGADGNIEAVIVRTQQMITGEIYVNVAETGQGELRKITVRIRNTTPFTLTSENTRDEALLRSIVSTHMILVVKDGEFVSLLDPAEQFVAAAAGCEQKGAYPVLAGVEGSRDCMLSSPIILYDYPQIADESAGDLFDGTEIDEILTLRIMTMTDEEKREMRAVDDRARKILERTEQLPEEHLLKMHGTLRGLERSKKANYG